MENLTKTKFIYGWKLLSLDYQLFKIKKTKHFYLGYCGNTIEPRLPIVKRKNLATIVTRFVVGTIGLEPMTPCL